MIEGVTVMSPSVSRRARSEASHAGSTLNRQVEGRESVVARLFPWLSPSWPRRALAPSLVAAAALTIATMGIPSLLVIAGAWSLAAIANRWFKDVAGPAAWAVGVVVEVTLLGAESALMAVVWPHNQPQFVYVALLAAPLLISLVLYWWFTSVSRPRTRRENPGVSGEPWLALIAIVLIEAMFEAIKLHGHDFGITWAMGGDARNNVAFNRHILALGGVTIHDMKTYPALINAVCALLAGASGRAGLAASSLMIRDVQALVATFILASIGIALFFIAATAEAFRRGGTYVQRLPSYTIIPLGACGSISIGAFVLGLGLSGGFLSALGCLALAGASLVIGMRMMSNYSNLGLVLLTISLYLVVMSWTFLIVVPVAALLLAYWKGLIFMRTSPGEAQRQREVDVTKWFLLISMAGTGVLILALVLSGSTLVTQIKTAGGIVGPNPRLFVWLGIVCLMCVLVARGREQRLVRLVPLVVYVISAGMVLWIRSFHPANVNWSYYATKMIWLATAMVLWTPFILLIDVVKRINEVIAVTWPRIITSAVVAVAGSSGLLWGIGHETPFPFPWTWAFIGSTIPSPQEIQLVAKEANIGGPFVIWQYSTAYEDQLGNFWSALTWEYNPDGTIKQVPGKNSFVNWASQETGTLANLCQVVSDYQLRVVTTNSRLVPTLLATCKGYRPVPSQAHER